MDKNGAPASSRLLPARMLALHARRGVWSSSSVGGRRLTAWRSGSRQIFYFNNGQAEKRARGTVATGAGNFVFNVCPQRLPHAFQGDMQIRGTAGNVA